MGKGYKIRFIRPENKFETKGALDYESLIRTSWDCGRGFLHGADAAIFRAAFEKGEHNDFDAGSVYAYLCNALLHLSEKYAYIPKFKENIISILNYLDIEHSYDGCLSCISSVFDLLEANNIVYVKL